MMHPSSFRLLSITLAASMLLMGGCFKLSKGERQPVSFYSLSHLSRSETDVRAEKTENPSILAVDLVRFPEYLNQPQIVSRESDNKLHMEEFHRWAEPLKDNFERTLKENLSILTPDDRFLIIPWKAAVQIDYEVAVEVIRFDGKLGGDAFLTAAWAILDEGGKEVLRARKSTFNKGAGHDYESLVRAMSSTLIELSREIAAALDEIP